MNVTYLDVICRDPIVSRDGRPFGVGQGNRMRTVGWPLPSVVAGSVRTAIGKDSGKEFSPQTAEELLEISVAGCFPVSDGQLYLPAPQDCLIHPEQGPLRVTPQELTDGGCDWPVEELRPVLLSKEQAGDGFKPSGTTAWWPLDRYAAWLTGEQIRFDTGFLQAPQRQERTHVSLEAQTGTADEGSLFTTAALPLTHLPRHGVGDQADFRSRYAAISLAVKVTATGWCSETASRLNSLHPLGGERRLAKWRSGGPDVWTAPKAISQALERLRRVRMVLASPAIFEGGWKPGWLDRDLAGTPPGAQVVLRLVGVSTRRWQAVSGWSLANRPGQPVGPKPVKRMVPAGGVYFFEVASGHASSLGARWLEPVSDGEQDRRDGFGLAAWGTW